MKANGDDLKTIQGMRMTAAVPAFFLRHEFGGFRRSGCDRRETIVPPICDEPNHCTIAPLSQAYKSVN